MVLSVDDERLIIANRLYPSKPNLIWGDEEREAGDIAVWFLYKGEGWDVGRVYTPRGVFRGYYADAVDPICWHGSNPATLEPLVDLFLDIWVWPDGRHTLLDEDELVRGVEEGHVSPSQAEWARETMRTLAAQTQSGHFPPAEVVNFELMPEDLEALLESDFKPRGVDNHD